MILILLALLLSCSPASDQARRPARTNATSAEEGRPMADATTPAALIELAVKETGERYRIMDDGRYLVTGPDGIERETTPMSKTDRGTPRLTRRALTRLRAAIAKVGFGTLPDTVPGLASIPAGIRPTGGGPAVARTFIFRVGPKSVAVQASARLEPSFGRLSPLWKVLDEEALGGWAKE